MGETVQPERVLAQMLADLAERMCIISIALGQAGHVDLQRRVNRTMLPRFHLLLDDLGRSLGFMPEPKNPHLADRMSRCQAQDAEPWVTRVIVEMPPKGDSES